MLYTHLRSVYARKCIQEENFPNLLCETHFPAGGTGVILKGLNVINLKFSMCAQCPNFKYILWYYVCYSEGAYIYATAPAL